MTGASSIELVSNGGPALTPLIGKKVVVIGELLPTYIPHYHAYLVMQVESIREEL
jgi:hypothetical protein